MRKKVLSIIVPVYNTGKYIKKCLDSLVNQTLKNFEIIIVNDCSTDNSEEIILDYINLYNNIKYKKLNKNHGVGYARKIGSELAEAEYIAFIDSDDWVELNYYEKMLDHIIKTNSDVAISSVITEYNNTISSKERYCIPYDNVITSDFALKIMSNYYSQGISISPNMNNRIYKRSIIVDNDLCCENSRQAQDNYSSFMCFVLSTNVCLVANTFYHYYQRDNSAVHSFSETYVNNYFNVLDNIKSNLSNLNIFDEYKNVFMSFIDRSLIWITKCLLESNLNEQEKKEIIKTVIKRLLNIFDYEEYVDYFDTSRIIRIFLN